MFKMGLAFVHRGSGVDRRCTDIRQREDDDYRNGGCFHLAEGRSNGIVTTVKGHDEKRREWNGCEWVLM